MIFMDFDKWKNTKDNYLEGEEWKPVPGFNQTEASNFGRVRCTDRWVKTGGGGVRFVCGKVRSQRLGKDGYLRTDAAFDGKCKKVTAHRMCALAFKKNPLNKKTVQHSNNVKHCNEEWNLEWFTQSEQVKDAFNKGRKVSLIQNYPKRGKEHYLNILSDNDVIEIFKSKEMGRVLSKRYGISETVVSQIRHSKRRQYLTDGIIQ